MLLYLIKNQYDISMAGSRRQVVWITNIIGKKRLQGCRWQPWTLLLLFLMVAISSSWSQSQTCLQVGAWVEVDACASPEGTIYDNGGPDNVYSNDFEGGCVIVAYPGMTLSLSGNYVTENNYDKIYVYDGYGESGTLLVDGVSGASSLLVSSSTGFLSIKFVSDEATQMGGFAFQYTVSGYETACENAVTGLSVSSVTQHSAVLNWSAVEPLRPFVVTVNGEAQTVAGNTLSLYTLAPGRHYDVTVVDSSNGGSPCCYARTSFHTLCADSLEAPVVELFDDYGTGVDVMPDCWIRLSNYDDALNQPQIVSSPEGEGGMLRMYCGSNSMEDHFSLAVGPVVTSNINVLQGRLKIRSTQVGATVEIGFCEGTTLYTSRFVPVDTLSVSVAGVWEEHVVDFASYSGDGHRMAIRMLRSLQGGNGWSLWVDEMTIEACGVRNPVVFNRSHRSLWAMWDSYGNPVGVDMEYGPPHFVPGTGTTLTGVVSPCRVPDLQPDTEYEFRLKSHCGSGVSSLSYLSFEGKTLEVYPVNLDYCEGFEMSGSSLPQGWRTAGEEASGNGCQVQTERVYRGEKALRFSSDNSHPLRTLVLPVIDTADVSDMKMSMAYYPPSVGYLVVGVMESPENANSFTPVDTVTSPATGWSQQVVDFSRYEGTGCWIALRLVGSAGNACYFDNFQISPCMLTGAEATHVTMSSVELLWDLVSDAFSGDSVRIVWGTTGFDVDTVTPISVAVHGAGVDTVEGRQRYLLSGLQPDTDYEVIIFGVCDAQVQHCEGNRLTVHTNSHSLELPYCEGFEATDAIPEGWTVVHSWGIYPRVGSVAGGAHGGNRCLQLDSYGGQGTDDNMVALPLLETGNVGETVLSFFAWSECSANRLEVGVMETPGNPVTFIPVDTLILGTGQWRHYAVSLSGYAGNGRYIALRKYATGSCPNGSRLYLDDLVLNSCQTTNVRHGQINSHSVTIMWDSVGSVFEGAIVEIGRSGFQQGEGIRSGVVRGGRLMIDTLMPGTSYDYFVHPQCLGESALCDGIRFEFSTLSEALHSNWCHDFEGQEGGGLPDSWYRPWIWNGHPQVVSRPDAATGHCVRFQSNGSHRSMLVLPPIEEELAGLTLRACIKGSFDTENNSWIVVGFVNDGMDTSSFEAVDTIQLSHADFRNYSISLSDYTGAGRCVALLKEGDSYAWIDDLSIGKCFTDSLRVSDINDTSAVVSWIQEGANTVVLSCNEEAGNYTFNDTVTLLHSDTLLHLLPGRDYRVQVTALCSGVTQYCSNEVLVFTTTVRDSCASNCMVAEVSVSDVTDSSLTLHWQRGAYDDTTYIAYGQENGFALLLALRMRTADTLLTIVGLASGQTYRFCLWGSCQDTTLLCQASQIAATLADSSAAPQDTVAFICSVTNPTEHSFDLGCNAFPSVDTVWVEYRIGWEDYPLGSGTLLSLTDSVFTLTGLEEGSDYTFHFLRPCMGGGDTCGFLTVRNRTLHSVAGLTTPYCEEFENSGVMLPSGWIAGSANVSPYPAPAADIAMTGNRSLEFFARPETPCVVTLPSLDTSENAQLLLSFYAYVNSLVAVRDSGVLRVGLLSNPSDLTTFILVDTLRFDTLAQWHHFVVDLAAAPVTHRYITLVFAPQSGNARCYVDNLQLARCALGNASVQLSGDSVWLQWSSYNQPDSVVVEYGPQGFSMGDFSADPHSPIVVQTSPVAIPATDFSFTGAYVFSITPYCSGTLSQQCPSVLLHLDLQDTASPPVVPPDTVTTPSQEECPRPHAALVGYNTVVFTVDTTFPTVDYWVACCASDTMVLHVTALVERVDSLLPNTLYNFLFHCDSAVLANALEVPNDSLYRVSITTGFRTVLPYCENFDGSVGNILPTGWRGVSSNNAFPTVSSSDSFGRPGNALQLNVSNATQSYCLATLPEFEIDSIRQLYLSLQFQSQYPYTGYLSLEVGVMSSPDDGATFVPVDTVANSERGFFPHQVSFDSYRGDARFLALRARNTSGYDRNIYVDDIVVETCHIPVSTKVSLTDHNQVCIHADCQTATGFFLEYGTEGFIPGTGRVLYCDTLPMTITLENETTYDFYFNCDSTGDGCRPLQRITTLPPPVALSECLYSQSTNQDLLLTAEAGSRRVTLLPTVAVDSLEGLAVSFYLTESMPGLLELGVMRSGNEPTSFLPLDTLQGDGDSRTHITSLLRNIPVDARLLALRLTAEAAAFCQIDNLSYSYCGAWDAQVATMESEFLVLDWQETGSPIVSIEYGPSGFAEGSGTRISIDQPPPFILTGLAPLTAYDIFFHAYCRDSLDDPCGVNYHRRMEVFTPAGGTGCIDPTNLIANYTTCYYGSFNNPRQYTGIVDFGFSDARSRHTVHFDTSETDMRTGGLLRTIPDGALASVRLGNWEYNNQNPEAESVEYALYVNPDDFDLLILKYAAVLQDPMHASEDQPRFTLEILDNNHNVVSQCASADFRADYSLGWNLVDTSNVLWKDWTTVGIDMSSYANQTVFLRLTTYDCNEGSHYGYAYFTLECSRISMRTDHCGDVTDNTFTAPAGFQYRWYSNPDSVASTVFSTLQTVTLPADNRTYYCDCSFMDSPDCRFTLTAYAGSRYPLAIATPVVRVADCRFYVNFTNGSTISNDGITPLGTGEPCETAQWWFGNNDTATSYNASTVYYDTGTYEVILVSGIADNSCTDTLHYLLRLDWPLTSATIEGDSSICMGDSVLLQAVDVVFPQWSTGDTTGSLMLFPEGDTTVSCRIVNGNGCFDTLSFDIKVHDAFHYSDTVVVCVGNLPLEWADTIIGAEALSGSSVALSRMLHSRYGCDSLLALNLTVNNNTYASVSDTIAESLLPYTFHHRVYTTGVSGDTLHLVNHAGCDSVVAFSLFLIQDILTVLDTTVCIDNFPLFWHGHLFSQPGTSFDTLSAVSGADSILQLNLSAVSPFLRSDTLVVCPDALPLSWLDTTISLPATSLPASLSASLVRPNPSGCDSVFSLFLTVKASYSVVDSLRVCSNQLPLSWRDTTFATDTPSGLYTRSLTAANGCDSSLSLLLTVNPAYNVVDTLRVCRNQLPISWRDTSFAPDAPTGRYERYFSTANGCDSSLSLQLYVNDVYQFTDHIESCDPITWIDGLTYGARTYGPHVTFTSQAGCDSIITLDFRLKPPTLTSVRDSFCANTAYTFAGHQITQSGIFFDTLTRIDGCDSIIQLVLTRLELPKTTLHIDADCIERGYWITVNSDVDYHYWSLSRGHWNDSWSPQNSTYLWVKPIIPIELTLLSDYTSQPVCPVTQTLSLEPLKVPNARIVVAPEQITEEKDNFIAVDRSTSNTTRVWWVDDIFYGDDERIWCRPDFSLDSVTLTLIALTEYCNDTAVRVIPIYHHSIYAPNAFTPAADDNNRFLLFMDGIVQFELSVYNRAGLRLFHTTDPALGWDGTANGKPCPQDSYVWIVTFTTNDKPRQPQTLKGTVTLIR